MNIKNILSFYVNSKFLSFHGNHLILPYHKGYSFGHLSEQLFYSTCESKSLILLNNLKNVNLHQAVMLSYYTKMP